MNGGVAESNASVAPGEVQGSRPAVAVPYVSDPDFTLYNGDVRDVLASLPAASVDCCVTSPPYWGLRDYGTDGQLGLESTPEEYVAAMVGVFAAVRRVLLPGGTCWLNLGDSYASAWACDRRNIVGNGSLENGKRDARPNRLVGGLKEKDLVGIPWRVAFALQADGWYLRSDIIWAKPNPMPESVTDRPTKAHEYLFLLTKSARYFYDATAIAEPATWYGPNGQPKDGPHAGQMRGRAGASWEERKTAGATRGNVAFGDAGTQRGVHGEGVSHDLGDGLTRNARSVWTIQTQQYADAHFAVFPEELPRRCILAGSPEWVCATCGKPRERVTERGTNIHPGDSGRNEMQGTVQRGKREDGKAVGTVMRERHEAGRTPKTVGWTDCGHGNYVAGTVLDPFMGSGTTALVARRHGRKSIGIELNETYCALAAKRLGQQSLLTDLEVVS